MQIGILGGGTMGEIITRALIEKEAFQKEEILVAETAPERQQVIASLGVRSTIAAEELLPVVDVLILCVKPQNARAALGPLQGKIRQETLVISIMAGIGISYLADLLQHSLIIRSMPNLPARIGTGVTVWRAADAVPDRLRVLARMIFQAFGREVEVNQSGLLDAATAVSGTGPAYIFYIAENLLQAAVSFGFNEQQALKLVRETFRGAMDLWAETGESPVELRRKVTSKGGTTHAAITYFQQHDIAGIFRAGVAQANARAQELGELAQRPEQGE